MLTKLSKSGVKQRAIMMIISGNRPRELIEEQTIRYATFDGPMSDLETNVPNDFMPIISDNWTKHFTWQGVGEMPEYEREKLNNIVKEAHNQGQILRFWATPDQALPNREAIWNELLKAGVDLNYTDDLAGLQQYLLEHDPNPTKPHIES